MRTAHVLALATLLLGACSGSRAASEERNSISTLTNIDPTLEIEEQLLRIPGVNRNAQGEIRIRGSNAEPLLVVDDVTAMSFDLTFLNPADVEKIEVLKGPATARYGSRGGGGVVRIFTKRPPDMQ